MTSPVTGVVGRGFFRTVRRRPLAVAVVAAAGMAVGSWFACLAPARDQALVSIEVLCLVFYAGLLLLLLVKLRRGNWEEFCDRAGALFPGDGASISSRVAAMNAAALAHPCPRCCQRLEGRTPGNRTLMQVLWGGWSCPACGADVDRFGKLRRPGPVR